MTTCSSWKRKRPRNGDMRGTRQNTFDTMFDDEYTDANIDLDIDTKLAALKVSSSVISLVSYTGGGEFNFACSGTIVSTTNVDATYFSNILTTASLIRSSSNLSSLDHDIRIRVYQRVGIVFDAKLIACDMHYNIALLQIETNTPLPTATLRLLNDFLPINPSDSKVENKTVCERSWQSYPHSDLFKLRPGDSVIAVGRFWKDSYELMAAPGKFSADCCDLDCTELFYADCKITKCGTGGPLVNRFGEVVGVMFYSETGTPFLPINIVDKFLKQFNSIRESSSPWLGMGLANLYVANISDLEVIFRNFPNIFKGVLVEKVTQGSPADCAGILVGDVIIQLGKNTVQSVMQLFGIVWDKIGRPIELTVLRVNEDVRSLKLTMVVGETKSPNFYSWPLPEIWQSLIPRDRVREDI